MIYSIISAIAGTMCVLLGAYVLLRNPYLRGSRIFILFMSLASLMSFSDYLMVTATNAGTASFFAIPTLFFSICSAACLPYLSFLVPCEREMSLLVQHRFLYLAVVVLSAMVPVVLMSSVSLDQYGWWVSADLDIYVWMIIGCLYCSLSMCVLLSLSRKARSSEVRRSAIVLAIGAAFPLIYGTMQVLTDIMNLTTPDLLAPTVLSTGLIFLYALTAHGLFTVRPVDEEVSKDWCYGMTTKRIRKGSSWLIESKGRSPVYDIFMSELASGGQGLIISRRHPNDIRSSYGLTRTPILWLSTQPHPDRVRSQRTIGPEAHDNGVPVQGTKDRGTSRRP